MALLNENRMRVPLVATLPVTGDDGSIRGQQRMTIAGTTNDMVTCLISDTGGTDSTVDIGAGAAGLTFTSKLFGVLGDAITVAFTDNGDGGLPVSSTTTLAISVTADITTTGTATAAQIKTAIEADADAAALVDVTLIGDGTGLVAVTGATNLASGVGDKADLVIDGVTFTAVEGGAAGNDITIEYVEGGTAATVAVTGEAIVVTAPNAESGTGIVDAVNASTRANKLVVASGTTGSFATAASAPLTGGLSNSVWA